MISSQTPKFILDEQTVMEKISGCSEGNPGRQHSGAQPAYMIYTSGSTGRPKGVVVQAESLFNFLLSMQDMFPLNQDDRLLAVTTIAFDISALEIYLPLISGSAVVLAEKETVQDPPHWLK